MEKGLREVLTEEFSFWEKLSDTEREKLLAPARRARRTKRAAWCTPPVKNVWV